MSGNAFTRPAPCRVTVDGMAVIGLTKHDVMGIRYETDPANPPAPEPAPAPKPPEQTTFTQADLDRITGQARIDERKKYADYDQLKADSAALAEAKKNGMTPEQKLIDEAAEKARAEGRDEVRAELHRERAERAFEKAIDGRTLNNPTVLIGLDLGQFIKDGKVDTSVLDDWVKANTAESKEPKSKDKAQGTRDTTAGGGSVQAGREAYEARRGKKSTTSNS